MRGNVIRGSGGRFAGSTGGGGGNTGSSRAAKLAALKERVQQAQAHVDSVRGKKLKALALTKAVADIGGLQNSHYLRNGMRDMTHARSLYVGKSAQQANQIARSLAYPVRVHVESDSKGRKTVILNDGRHRLAAAREAGATHIRARVIEYGARGGKRREWNGIVKI